MRLFPASFLSGFLLRDLFSQSGHGFLLLQSKKSGRNGGVSEAAGRASVLSKGNREGTITNNTVHSYKLYIQVYQIKESTVFQEKHRNPNDKIPLSCFVPESEHSSVHPNAPEHCRHEKKQTFRNSLRSCLSRLHFVAPHDEKCSKIHQKKKSENKKQSIGHVHHSKSFSVSVRVFLYENIF